MLSTLALSHTCIPKWSPVELRRLIFSAHSNTQACIFSEHTTLESRTAMHVRWSVDTAEVRSAGKERRCHIFILLREGAEISIERPEVVDVERIFSVVDRVCLLEAVYS